MKLSPRAQRLLWWTAALLALALVSAAYTRPELMVELANRAWACF